MCVKCDIEDTIIDMARDGHVDLVLDGEPLTVSEALNLIHSPIGLDRVMVQITERGREAADLVLNA